MWNFTPTLLVIYTLYWQTDRQTDWGLHMSLDGLLQSGKQCMGLVVKVTDIKRMKNCTLVSMQYRIIYSTSMFHRRVKHGDKKKTLAVEMATPFTISWHDSEVVRLSIVFPLDLEHYFLRVIIKLFSTAVHCILNHNMDLLTDWWPKSIKQREKNWFCS